MLSAESPDKQIQSVSDCSSRMVSLRSIAANMCHMRHMWWHLWHMWWNMWHMWWNMWHIWHMLIMHATTRILNIFWNTALCLIFIRLTLTHSWWSHWNSHNIKALFLLRSQNNNTSHWIWRPRWMITSSRCCCNCSDHISKLMYMFTQTISAGRPVDPLLVDIISLFTKLTIARAGWSRSSSANTWHWKV